MANDVEKLPREFGKYHLIERIATGGMAELYRAKLYGAGGFEKDLAIKKVLPSLSTDNDFVQMFMDEAMITVTLSHGNIVSIIDFGELDGEYFLVMEYVDGVDLQSLIKKSQEMNDPIPPPIACYIALEVCRGLDYAHRKVGADGNPLQIVHRDISPQNILLSFEGEVKIVDFGIARAASRITSTQAGVVKGKLAYMSPEQISGQKVDRRADVYSAGTLLYEMLTNRRPFEGSTPQETMAMVTRGVFDKPHKLNKKVDKKLSAVIRKGLEKNPKKRFQTSGEMAADLSSYLHRAGIYPDATTLASFIPQRLPDARPRTIQPTPIRAIRRDTDSARPKSPEKEKDVPKPVEDEARPGQQPRPGPEPRKEGTDVLDTPDGDKPQDEQSQPAPVGQEAISFKQLDLPDYEPEPSDSTRPTDPLHPRATEEPSVTDNQVDTAAAESAPAADEQVAAQEQAGKKETEQPAEAPEAYLLSAKTRLLPQQEASDTGAGETGKSGYDPDLLSAKTRMLPSQEEASEDQSSTAQDSGSRHDPALHSAETRMLPSQEAIQDESAGGQVEESWMQGSSGQVAATQDSLESAAFPRRNTGLKIAAGVAGLLIIGFFSWLILFHSPASDDTPTDDKVEPASTNDTPREKESPVSAEDSQPVEDSVVDGGASEKEKKAPVALTGEPDAGETGPPDKEEKEKAGKEVAVKDVHTGDEEAKTEPKPEDEGKTRDRARKDPGPGGKAKTRDKRNPDHKVSTHSAKNLQKRRKKKRKTGPRVAKTTPASGKTGILRINSEPFSVVFRGRKKIGPTPQMNVKLPVGSHTLTLKNEALGITKRIRVRIEAGKVHTFFVDLKKD